MQLKTLKEQWLPTSLHASFRIPSQSSLKSLEQVPLVLDLPLRNIGWTFSVILTRHRVKAKTYHDKPITRWSPQTLSFRASNGSIPWGSTSVAAELRFGCDVECDMCNKHFPEPSSGPCPHCSRTDSGSISLGTLTIDLANNTSGEVLLKSDPLALGSVGKLGLAVILSDCPFADGLFQVGSDYVSQAEAPPQTRGRNNDDILCRSLTTGRLFDVTFLTFRTTRCTPRQRLFDEPIPTYAPLSVVEQQIDISSAKLQQEWKSAFATADRHNSVFGKFTCEIGCPVEYDYDLDSDYEDEFNPSSIPTSPPHGRGDEARSEGEHSGDETKRSSSSVIIIESAEAMSEDLIDNNPLDIVKISEATPPLSPAAPLETARTVLIKFAAHRTWHSFLWYCYTGSVRFGKLRSQSEAGEQLQDGPPACSPKSMYRLADLLGNNVLKAKALEAIRERLTETNIVQEAFSEFTTKYREVQDVQLLALLKHCQLADVKTAFLKMVLRFHTMPHAEPMLAAFYDKLTQSCQ